MDYAGVRGKFRVEEVAHVAWNANVVRIKLVAVANDGTPENERFHKATPSGSIEMLVDNPRASDKLKIGHSFYVDFTDA